MEIASGPARPRAADVASLRPLDRAGWTYLIGCSGATALALVLSSAPGVVPWVSGQVLLSLCLLQWFVLLHEAGHRTLFRSRGLNALAGHVASFWAGIPFASWRHVHQRHHVWTGWQDVDATTAALAPRRRSRVERVAVNVCWRLWIPVFSVAYRIQNYWHLPRLFGLFRQRSRRREILAGASVLAASYAAAIALAGPEAVLRLVGLGLLLNLVQEDLLLLSQHTHVPMHVAAGRKVKPFVPEDQEVFTRSLAFPTWFSVGVLVGVDAHELPHMHPRVPGYLLHRVAYRGPNEGAWWRWVLAARRIPGEGFLFQNRDQSGLDV